MVLDCEIIKFFQFIVILTRDFQFKYIWNVIFMVSMEDPSLWNFVSWSIKQFCLFLYYTVAYDK